MINTGEQFYKEVRCTGCRTLLAYEYIYSGRLMIKCRKCGEMNVIQYKTPAAMIQKLQENENPEGELVLFRKQVFSTKNRKGVNKNG